MSSGFHVLSSLVQPAMIRHRCPRTDHWGTFFSQDAQGVMSLEYQGPLKLRGARSAFPVADRGPSCQLPEHKPGLEQPRDP